MEFELSRIEDYFEHPEGECDRSVDMDVYGTLPISICTQTDKYRLQKPCKIIFVG